MTFRSDIRARAAKLGATVVLAEGWDERVQEAARIIESEKLGEVIVLARDPGVNGTVKDVGELLQRRKPERVRDDDHAIELARDPLRLAAGMVQLGTAAAAVGGCTCPTADVLRAALWAVGPAEGMKIVSSSFYMALSAGSGRDWWGRDSDVVLTVTDGAVVPAPDSGQLAEIALAASRDRVKIVGDKPRVAFLSYSTRGSAEGEMIDHVKDAVAAFGRMAPDICFDGELQVDAAIVPHIAASKAGKSAVEGRANVLVFPDLDAGNIAYKIIQRLGGAAAIGPIIQGLAKPVADLSRGATAHDIVDVACIAALQSAA